MPKGTKHRRSSSVAALSIKEFCEAHGISIAHFYTLKRKKQAPRMMRVGRRYLISNEAAAAWRASREE